MRKKLMTNFGLKILAFFIAAFMWLIVVNIDDPITDKTYSGVKVEVINAEVVTDSNRTYQIVDDTGEVNVTVTAKRSVLNKIRTEDITATADMKELTLGTQIPIAVDIKGYSGRYEKAYATPRNLQVQIDDEAKNNFPITPMATGTVREGYVLGNMTVDPEKVTIRGPKRVINSINRVVAEVDVSGLSKDSTLEARMVLYDANDNVIDQTLLANNLGKEGISVEVELYQVKTIPLKIDKSQISAASGYKIGEVSVEPQEIQVSGNWSDLNNLYEIDIPAEALQVSNLTERTEKKVDISPYLPEGVELVDENANSVVVSISVVKPGAKSFEVATSAITINNLAENLELSYGNTLDLEIQIQGPDEVLSVLSLAKKVSIDLKDYTTPGKYTVPILVELPEGCTLVKEVTVEILLEEKQ